MKTYADLVAEFNRKVAWLQKHCKHEETEVKPYIWALGHFSGSIRVCKCCRKTIKIISDPFKESWTTGANLISGGIWLKETP